MRRLFALALPVTLTYLGPIFMSFVDLLALGQLGAPAIAAAAVGTTLFFATVSTGYGLLSGLDARVSSALGAQNPALAATYWVQGLWLASLAAIPFTLLNLYFSYRPDLLGISPALAHDAGIYTRILSLSIFPTFLFIASRQYLQAVGRPYAGVTALLVGNLVNLAGNYALILGMFGFPKLGIAGSALATLLARILIMLLLLASAHRCANQASRYSLRAQRVYFFDLVKLGVPAGIQMFLEVGIYLVMALVAARLGQVALATNQIASNIINLSYMLPCGIGTATAILVARALGAGKQPFATREGNRSLRAVCILMASLSLLLCVIPYYLLHFYTQDPAVLNLGISLLRVAALVQFFEGIQVVLAGALRGRSDTQTAMYANFFCYWIVGLPVGLYLCFSAAWGLAGLWLGHALALAGLSLVLFLRWIQKSRALVSS